MLKQVSHTRSQYTKKAKEGMKHSYTQALDASWNELKKYRNMCLKHKENDGKANPDLFVWARAYAWRPWRKNTQTMDKDLAEELAKLLWK